MVSRPTRLADLVGLFMYYLNVFAAREEQELAALIFMRIFVRSILLPVCRDTLR